MFNLNIKNLTIKSSRPALILCRNMVLRKRFYKNCRVIASNGKYEVTLDHKKLKTPKGNPFQVDSEPLALAVAAEWDAQKHSIVNSNMHLTGLCNTVLDNPDKLTRNAIAQELVSYMDSDTIMYYSAEDDELYDLQVREWGPVTNWLCERHDINIRPTRNITGPFISDSDRQKLNNYFLSYNLWSIYGFRFAVEALKSVTLGLACADRFITVEQATKLSRLEEDFQSNRWGRVEWSHDLNELGTKARVAAGFLFIYANSSVYLTRSKSVTG